MQTKSKYLCINFILEYDVIYKMRLYAKVLTVTRCSISNFSTNTVCPPSQTQVTSFNNEHWSPFDKLSNYTCHTIFWCRFLKKTYTFKFHNLCCLKYLAFYCYWTTKTRVTIWNKRKKVKIYIFFLLSEVHCLTMNIKLHLDLSKAGLHSLTVNINKYLNCWGLSYTVLW